MNARGKGVAGAVVAVLAVSAPAATGAFHGVGDDRQAAIGLTADGRTLLSFKTDRAPKAKALGPVQGLSGDARLVGIDYRVQDGRLYGVGDAGGVYAIAGTVATRVSQLGTPLTGTAFGVDFNPAANRLRVVSDTGQSLRHNLDDGPTAGTTTVDGTLTYPPATTAATGVTGAGYTNNDLDPATATTLFDLDTTLDQVVLQSPANAGGLAATGRLGVDAARAGFDVFSDVRDGHVVANLGFAVVTVGSRSTVHAVDLLTGRPGEGSELPVPVADIAVALDR